ncbi:hypothetical protein J1614_005005 [Plenodomus biglobosus]|nr:hypothetical protein J1614_005005 [Plenodomus biglobosus]
MMSSTPDQYSLGTISRPTSSSSREASGLLSQNQLHRTSPGDERDTAAIVDHVEDGIETSPSPSPAPSKPSSIHEAKDSQPTSSHRAMRWKSVGMTIGFLFTALLSALGHYLLVRNLDGTITDTSYLTQSQVSAISILLTTIFKAALTACVGICFAQHLWFILSGNATSLSTIEKLFVFRTNIVALGHLRSMLRAPLLFLMALLIWCLGLATIYPPGALIVMLEAHTFTENYNMSVMNPPVPQDLDLAGIRAFPILSVFGFVGVPGSDKSPEGEIFVHGKQKEVLDNVAQSIITNNQVFRLLVQPGENSTFSLQFRGPQLRCTISHYHGSIHLDYILGEEYIQDDGTMSARETTAGLVFVSEYNSFSLSYSVTQHQIAGVTAQRSSYNVTSYEAFVETTKQSCEAVSVLYAVDVTFPHGVQTIQHSLSDEKALPKEEDVFDNLDNFEALSEGAAFVKRDSRSLRMGLIFLPEPLASQDWRQRLLTALPISNEWALLDALGSVLTGLFYEHSPTPDLNSCQKRDSPTNDTEIHDCWGWPYGTTLPSENNSSAPLKGTVFHTARFQRNSPGFLYDPRTDLDITEDLLNSVLTNITLSAITLGTWWDMVPVTTTRYRSTYSFANPFNLILPYSICLTAATIFVAISIWSLWQNGIPAADGGFLQIMIATRGNTAMERLVLQERPIGIDNISDELKSLKVRYGELATEEAPGIEGRRLGFGTAEETLSLRKRRRRFE